jgi:hypothetical protein
LSGHADGDGHRRRQEAEPSSGPAPMTAITNATAVNGPSGGQDRRAHTRTAASLLRAMAPEVASRWQTIRPAGK